jgi:hypothetical protein
LNNRKPPHIAPLASGQVAALAQGSRPADAVSLIGADGCEIGVMAGPAEWDSPEALAVVKAAIGG